MVSGASKGSDQPAHTCSLIRAFAKSLEYSMTVKLLNEHNLEFLSLTGDCTGSSESTLVKMPHCWKSRVASHLVLYKICFDSYLASWDFCCLLIIFVKSLNADQDQQNGSPDLNPIRSTCRKSI